MIKRSETHKRVEAIRQQLKDGRLWESDLLLQDMRQLIYHIANGDVEDPRGSARELAKAEREFWMEYCEGKFPQKPLYQ